MTDYLVPQPQESGLLTPVELTDLLQELPQKERVFCENYIIKFNASEAGRTAGYSKRTVGNIAHELLKKPRIQRYLAHLVARRSVKTGITAEMVVTELARIAFQDLGDFVSFDGKTVILNSFDDIGDKTCNIKKIKITDLYNAMDEKVGQKSEIELHDKMKALELLGRHTAAFTDNVNITNSDGSLAAPQQVINIQINHRKKGEKLSE